MTTYRSSPLGASAAALGGELLALSPAVALSPAETPPTPAQQGGLARRAALARRLVKHGLFDPAEALAVTVWPTEGELAVLAFAADEWVLLHGTLQGYKEGCRCGQCRSAKRMADKPYPKGRAA